MNRSSTQTSASGDGAAETSTTRGVPLAAWLARKRWAIARQGASSTPIRARLGARHQALLDRGVVVQRPVAIEMIGRDVDQRADARRQRRGEIDLERRAFDDVDAPVGRRQQIENRHADVAAHRHVAAGLAQDMGDQRRRRRLAVGSGDGHERRARRARGALAGEEFDVADDSDAGRLRPFDRPVRLGMGQRHARREHERREAAPVDGGQIDRREALCGGARTRLFVVVPGGDPAPPAASARKVASPEPPSPKTATLQPRRVSTGVMLTSASRSPGRPSRARRRRSRSA